MLTCVVVSEGAGPHVMLTARVGFPKMSRRSSYKKWLLEAVLVLVPLIVILTLLVKKYSNPLQMDLPSGISTDLINLMAQSSDNRVKHSVGMCQLKMDCPEDQISYVIQSGAANVIPPKICLQDKLVLGSVLNNAGVGINIVVINGNTGEFIKSDYFNMYSGEVGPLIVFLQSLEEGSVVLMVTYDEPSSKLNDEARKLISDLGSTVIRTLGFRDSWVFVGGKGIPEQSRNEKHIKNNEANNKYDNWPELIEMKGCIPKKTELKP